MMPPRASPRAALLVLFGVTLLVLLAWAAGAQAIGAFAGNSESSVLTEGSPPAAMHPLAGTSDTQAPAAPRGANAASAIPHSSGNPRDGLAAPQSELINSLRLEDSFGVQVIGAVDDSLDNGGAAVRDAGARFVNFGIDWGDLAPLTTTQVLSYTWAPFDAAISEATALGFSVIATLGGNPTWAASYRRGPVNCAPLNRWDEYVTAVVQRYKGSVRYWVIYNEPDGIFGTSESDHPCPGFPGEAADFGGHPEEYVEILRRAHDIIALEDPEAVVLFGGIAYDWFTDEDGHFVRDFLTDTLELGAADYFDAMNFHYYPAYDFRWAQPSGRPGLIGKTESVRTTLQSHGADKPLFLTEMGSSSHLDGETEDLQARKVIQYYSRAISAGVKVSIWYTLQDYGEVSPFRYHGLLTAEYEAKLSLSAYRTLTARLNGHSYLRPLAATEWAGSSLEGYVFQRPAEALQTSVVWTSDCSTQTLTLPTGVVSVTDKYGVPRPFGITATVDGDPTFVLRNRIELYLPLVQRQ